MNPTLSLLASAAGTAAQPVALSSLSIGPFWVAVRYDERKTTDRASRPRLSFERSGVVSVLFNMRSEERTSAIVVDSRYCAKSDKRGHFKTPDVPAGRCTIRAWHQDGKTASFAVKVAESTKDISLTAEGE